MSHSDDILAELRLKVAQIEQEKKSHRTKTINNHSITDGSASQIERNTSPYRVVSSSRASKNPAHENAFSKIKRLACMREQSSAALRKRLVKEGYGETEVEEALERAISCGLIDDLRFAEVLIRSRFSQGRGVQGILRELHDLEITQENVLKYLEEQQLNSDSEETRALNLLNRKPPRAKNKREAAYRKLIQNGYSSSTSSTVARQWYESISSHAT